MRGKGVTTGQARAFALAPPKKRISLPLRPTGRNNFAIRAKCTGKGLKGWGLPHMLRMEKLLKPLYFIGIMKMLKKTPDLYLV
jgi:hypothetical protein